MIGGQRHSRQQWLHPEDSKKEESLGEAVQDSVYNEQQNDGTAAPGDFSVDIQLTSESQPTQEDSTYQPQHSESSVELPSLEVGVPGNFASAVHEHNEKDELSINSNSSAGASSPDFMAMLDEPMPDSLGGGSTAIQSMFVEEVLRGAKTADSEQSSFSQPLAEVEFGPKADTSNDQTIATTVSALAVDQDFEQPDSPRVSELREKKPPEPLRHQEHEEATKVVQGSTKINVSDGLAQTVAGQDDRTKVTSNSEADKTVVGKANGKKEKSAKKNSSGTKKSAEAKSQQVEQEAVAPLSETAATIIAPGKRRKELRWALGVLVVSVSAATTLIVTKKYVVEDKPVLPAQLIEKADKKDDQPAVIDLEKGALSGDSDGEPPQVKVEDSQKSPSVVADKAKSPLKPKTMNAKEEPEIQSESDTVDLVEDSDTEVKSLVLTRPNSRYSETNLALRPLIDLALALDRVQPRKALNLLKQLPDSFASTNIVERVALREITARYYLQVGAYAKAVKLFREVCLDPNGASDLEMCLHAARGFVVMGQIEEADALIDSLKMRAVKERSLWIEWANVLEAAQGLSEPIVANFIRFVDEFSEKAPYMTSEWNLQLSTFFARKFSALTRDRQLAVLKQFDKSRRRTVEVRLAPTRYGPDIGSFMLPSFLNLYFRVFELPEFTIDGEEPETDSQASLVSWTFFAVSQSKANELRQTRARLAPLFAERAFAPLARVIEAHLAAQAGDFLGASALMAEQVSLQPASQVVLDSEETREKNAALNFLKATQRFEQMPFLYVEWLYLGVKVAAGLNDLNFMTTVLTALEGVNKRFPEVQSDFQYWNILARGYKVLGKLANFKNAVKKAEAVAATKHELGFVTGYKVWLLMKSRKVQQARDLMKEGLRLYPHHARLLEYGAEFAAQWGEDPAFYLGLESEVPRQFQNRGRDRTLLSLFTVSKLLDKF